ncbi:hypothetical protein [Aliikangiella sp. G2MR2-5]|uniref:hypothetical protein n=1 Tax=Aliikangiella sp. G2MR2-5 TaxID=2788943 RepID=UPI0018AAF864|nr:hypothetical protein [Aliikangiella sp. G2MR2-5]
MLYKISCHDNDLYFFDEGEFKRCPECNELLDKWNEDLSNTKISKRLKADISCSYDGVTVVSSRFKDVCEANELTGLNFYQLNNDYYWILPDSVIRFDSGRKGLIFEEKCSECNNYESVVGASPVVLLESSIRKGNFAKTDLEFASNDEKHPLIICDEKAYSVLSKSDLKGLLITKIEQTFN